MVRCSKCYQVVFSSTSLHDCRYTCSVCHHVFATQDQCPKCKTNVRFLCICNRAVWFVDWYKDPSWTCRCGAKTCDFCKQIFPADTFAAHQYLCDYRVVHCPYKGCDFFGAWITLKQEHRCGYQPIPCKLCHQLVPKKDMLNHMSSLGNCRHRTRFCQTRSSF